MKNIKGSLLIIILIILAFLSGVLVGKFGRNEADVIKTATNNTFDLKLPGEVEKRVVTSKEIEAKLSEIAQLATYSAEYTVSMSENFSRHVLDDIPIPGTTNTIQIECQGLVKVGYNVQDIVPEVDNESHKIYIALPQIQVLDNYIIWDTVKCFEKNTILNPIDFAQYQSLISEIEADGLKKVEADGIYEKAKEHMELIIRNFLSGFHEFEVKFL